MITKNTQNNRSKEQSQAGIALLYSVVVSAVVLMLGASITGIALRELELVVAADSSSRAFYAADTALECAMYWDRKQGAFSGSGSSIDCAGATGVSVTQDSSNTYTFQLDDQGDASVCAEVFIEKDSASTTPDSIIRARGFNTCVPSDRQAERALRSAY